MTDSGASNGPVTPGTDTVASTGSGTGGLRHCESSRVERRAHRGAGQQAALLERRRAGG